MHLCLAASLSGENSDIACGPLAADSGLDPIYMHIQQQKDAINSPPLNFLELASRNDGLRMSAGGRAGASVEWEKHFHWQTTKSRGRRAPGGWVKGFPDHCVGVLCMCVCACE